MAINVRLLMGALAAAFMTGIAFTGSRGGYLSMATGLVGFLCVLGWAVKKLRPKRFLLILMISIITGSAAVVTAIALMSSNVLLTKRMEQVVDTRDMRVELWNAAIQQFHLAPILGTGSGTYLYYGRQYRNAAVQYDPIYTHNDHLQLLAEYGVVGASLAALFLLCHLQAGWGAITRIARRRLRPAKRVFSDEMALLTGSVAAVVALIAHAVVDFNAHIPGNALLYAFFFGILASPSADPQVAREDSGLLKRGARFVIPTLGAAMIVLALPLIRGEFHAEWARIKLRSTEYVNYAFGAQQGIVRVLPSASSGVPMPYDAGDLRLPIGLNRDLLRDARIRAEKAIRFEKQNPDVYFVLGQAHYRSAMMLPVSPDRNAALAAAAEAWRKGHEIFSTDVRLLLNLGRVLTDLGQYEAAEAFLAKAFAADPQAANVYAYYGYFLWSQRKLSRAEAYFRKAASMHGGVEFAGAFLRVSERIRALAQNAEYVDLYGDPLESYDLDPPTEGDEARGIRGE